MPEEYFDEEVNEETVGAGSGFTLVAPGYYFGEVVEVSNSEDSFFVEFKILSGTKPHMVGEVHREYFHWNTKKGNRSRRAALCVATGLWSKEQMAAARREGRGISWEPDDLLGRICCFEVINEEQEQGKYAGKLVAKIPYSNIWHPEEKEVARLKIPIDTSRVGKGDAFASPSLPPVAEAATGDSSFF